MKKDLLEGMIIESLPDLTFKVKLQDDREVLAYLAGKMRFHYIRVIPGDEVLVELSEYDKNRGRIVRRK